MAGTGFKSRPGADADQTPKPQGFITPAKDAPSQVTPNSQRSSEPLDDNLQALEDDFYGGRSNSGDNGTQAETGGSPTPDASGHTKTNLGGGRAEHTQARKPAPGESKPDAPSPAAASSSPTGSGGFGTPAGPAPDKNSRPKTSPAGGSGTTTKPPTDQKQLSSPEQPEGGKKQSLKALLKFAHKHRKKLFGGGGIAGVIVALVFLFIGLLPLKLEAIIKGMISYEAGPMEEVVERRVEHMVFKIIWLKVTGTMASDGFYVGNSLFSTAVGNVTINNFEQELLRTKGIKITKTGSHSIRFTNVNDGTSFDADSFPKLMEIINNPKDLKGRAAKKAIKAFVNETYHTKSYIKRRLVRFYLKNAFRIRAWSIPKKEDTKDPDNPDGPSSTVSAIQNNVLASSEAATINTVGCAFGDECQDPNERQNPNGQPTVRQLQAPDPENERTGDLAASEDSAKSTLRSGISDSYKQLKEATNKAIKEGMEKIFGEVISKRILNTVPVVGWIALAADIDAFLWSGNISRISVALRNSQYAGAAATYSSLTDQFKAGQLTGSQINVIMTLLREIEKSNGFQRAVAGNHDGGEKLPDDKRVGSDATAITDGGGGVCGITWFLTHSNDPAPTSDASSPDFWTWNYRMYMGAPPQFLHSTLCAVRGPLNKISAGFGWLIGDLLDAIISGQLKLLNATVNGLLGHPNPPVDVMESAEKGLKWAINHVWTPVVTGREAGIALGNAIDAGWDVIANQMCRDMLGCKNISYALSYQQKLALAEAHRAELRELSPLAALVNTDYPESFGSQMLAQLPATPGAAIGSLGSTSLAMISSPFRFFGSAFSSVFFPPVRAADDVSREPNGVQQTGKDEAELADPNTHLATTDIAGPPDDSGQLTGPDGRVNQYDCPVEKDANKSVPCLADSAAILMLCASTSNYDDGGLGGEGDPGPCGEVDNEPVVGAPAPPGAPGAPTAACQPGESSIDCASRLAAAILANGNITYVVEGGKSARNDLEATVNKQTITCAPKPAARLDPALLYALQQTATAGGFKIKLSNMITPHACDNFSHPKGKAFDVDNLVDSQGRNSDAGHNDRPSQNPAVDRAFAEYIAALLPDGGGVAQAGKCFPATIRPAIKHNYDACTHIHVTTAAP